MEAVERGYAGTGQRCRTAPQEGQEPQEPTEGGLEEHPMREEAQDIPEEVLGLTEEGSEEP